MYTFTQQQQQQQQAQQGQPGCVLPGDGNTVS